jgi:hypothetical protein
MRRYLLVLALAATMVLASAGAAFAGEVKGPWIDGEYNENVTQAGEHARSACAFSGLNDNDPAEGQNDSRVQTAADSWKYYGLPKGSVGTLGLCRGGGPAE